MRNPIRLRAVELAPDEIRTLEAAWESLRMEVTLRGEAWFLDLVEVEQDPDTLEFVRAYSLRPKLDPA